MSDPKNHLKVICNYCNREVCGITRLKYHLAGIRRDVSECEKVPVEVRSQFYKILIEKEKQKEKKTEELNRLRGEVSLIIEGEDSDPEKNIVQLRPASRNSSKGSVGGAIEKFCMLKPEEARKKGSRKKVQSIMTTKAQGEKRDRVCEYIAQWIYEAGIPHNAVTLPSFDAMLEAIGMYGTGLRGPSPYELSEPLLQKRKKEIQSTLTKHRETWELKGCSIMTDAWTDRKGRGIMNLLVHSEDGVCFIQSIDASAAKKDGAYIFEIVDRCIGEIGKENVVQVVTDGARPNQTMGTLLTEKYPQIYWTNCAAHCIDLMLEDIGKLPNVRKIIAKAKAITIFLYAHTRVLNLMRTHLGKDLVRAGVTRFATAFLNLKSIQERKDELKKLFRSDELDAWGYLKKEKGRKAAGYVRSDCFWQGVDCATKIFEPLVNVLRRVDGDVPAMGFLFGDLMDAKREIEILLDEDKDKYSVVHEIIDKRWDDKLKTPLHLAGFFLNPYYYYSNRMFIERNGGNFREGLISCMETMYDIETAEKMLEELPRYQRSEGSFGRPLAIKGRSTKKLNPAEWWSNYGASTPYLKNIAIRILSLTCSSSGCERNWSTFEQVHTKKRARLLHARLNDLVFVKFNSRILQKKQEQEERKGKNEEGPDVLEVHNVDVVADEANEWVSHLEEENNDEMETSKKRKTSASASSDANLAKKKRKIILLGKDNESPSSSDEDEENNDLSNSSSDSE